MAWQQGYNQNTPPHNNYIPPNPQQPPPHPNAYYTQSYHDQLAQYGYPQQAPYGQYAPPGGVAWPQAYVQIQQPQAQVQVQAPTLMVQAEPVQQFKPAAPTPQPQEPFSIDHEVLLSLADEYVAAARSLALSVAIRASDDAVEDYTKLMATGMACMESALRRYRLKPRVEAILRLKYASLIYSETINDAQAQEVLSKGMLLCDTNRLVNLKYSMHHLLARIMFRSAPKVALKSLDKVIAEADTLRHHAWVYALRFLRIALSVESGLHHDMLSALQQLRAISTLAEARRDTAIFVVCAAFETMTHLTMSGPDSIEQAQRAIASARTYQLELLTSSLPQVWAIIEVFDVICSIESSQWPDVTLAKLDTLQNVLNQQLEDKIAPVWDADGGFGVSVSGTDPALVQDSNGVFGLSMSGQPSLMFSWLAQKELRLLVQYLCGLMRMQTQAPNQIAVDRTLDQATGELIGSLNMAEAFLSESEIVSCTLPVASKRKDWHVLAKCQIYQILVLLNCKRSDWSTAQQYLDHLQEGSKTMEQTHDTDLIQLWNMYLKGLVAQATGDFTTAQTIFRTSAFSLPSTRPAKLNDPSFELKLLAAFNILLMIHPSWHPQHDQYQHIIAQLDPLCRDHPRTSIMATYSLLRALQLRDALQNPSENQTHQATITQHKADLSKALQEAQKRAKNDQLLALAFAFFRQTVFDRSTAAKAVDAGKSARVMARRAGSELWTAVSDGMFADTLGRCGQLGEAGRFRADGEKFLLAEPRGPGSGVPVALRRVCMEDGGGGVDGDVMKD